jgi:putative Ca2+/H+ antiporter (TMEM165/GDT1 family)
MRAYVAVFVSVFLAELGDKTQLATLLFAANPVASKTAVVIAAAAALCLSTVLAVIAGSYLGNWVPPRHLRVIAGTGFLAIGAWMILVRG